MAQYLLYHYDRFFGTITGQYVPENLRWSMRRSQPGDIMYELPLGHPFMTTPGADDEPEFGPYRTIWELYRASAGGSMKLLNGGFITSVNLNGDRDSVVVAGKDYLHYLQRRVFPFNPNDYLDGDWVNWPKGWPNSGDNLKEIQDDPVDVVIIVEQMLQAMKEVVLPDIPGVTGDTSPRGQLPIVANNNLSGYTTKYQILPGDPTSIFDHITRLSDQVEGGFDFEITPGSLEFRMYFPNRDVGIPIYTFIPGTSELFGQVVSADWTNDGPDGSFLWGSGVNKHRVGAVWYYKPHVDKFGWLDKHYDFGEMPNTDLILNMLKDQQDLYPQEKLSLSVLNPEYTGPDFYGADRPRSLLGNRIRFEHTWSKYREVDRHFLVNAINCSVDQSTNETVELELEIINEGED